MPGHRSNPAHGVQNDWAQLRKAPRPPSQATARPNRKDVQISGGGRDEAFRVVGFSPEGGGADSDAISSAPLTPPGLRPMRSLC